MTMTDPLPHPAPARPGADGLIDVPRGLAGVVAAETRIGDVRGAEGFYHYGPHSAVELAAERSLEEVWHLFVTGELPDPGELATFRAEVAEARARPLPDEVRRALPAIARAGGAGPLDALRTATSLLAAAEGIGPVLDTEPDALRAQGVRIVAVLPVLAAALHRLGAGLEPV